LLTNPNEESEKIELEERVVAIVDGEDSGGAVEAVRAGGWEVTTLDSEAEVERLEPKQGGIAGALSKAAAVFGDEMRIIDQVERALADGNQVVIVTGDADQAPAIAKVLREHGALSIWDFRSWTFVNVGSTDQGEEETG
jgi:hypothetical protein